MELKGVVRLIFINDSMGSKLNFDAMFHAITNIRNDEDLNANNAFVEVEAYYKKQSK